VAFPAPRIETTNIKKQDISKCGLGTSREKRTGLLDHLWIFMNTQTRLLHIEDLKLHSRTHKGDVQAVDGVCDEKKSPDHEPEPNHFVACWLYE
jgi:hypothetical protein